MCGLVMEYVYLSERGNKLNKSLSQLTTREQ